MKINNHFLASGYSGKTSKNNVKQSDTKKCITREDFPALNSSYLAFMGGYSVDLAKTYAQLAPEIYPPLLDKGRELEKVLKEGNTEDKTLYDIHFDKYKGILDCYSLDELKEKYPQFRNIRSVWDIEARENSFIHKYQFDNSDIFSSDEDLSLQLVKLYWGQGFSLSDLSKYIEENSNDEKGINLYYALTKKLNIPLMNSRYAAVLKLANKEYNDKFSEQMSIKRREAGEAKIQKAEGEPVIIPRGPLSDAHKKHISEGLKKYYIENPDAINKLSQRQKEFLENNPQFKEDMSNAMDFAWNRTREGKSVKKYLSKFIKKYHNINLERLTSQQQLTKEENSALDAFWKRNSWAHEKFSIACQKGWDYIKDISKVEDKPKENIYKPATLSLCPSIFRDEIKKFALKRGYDAADLDFAVVYINPNESQKNQKHKLSTQIMNEFYDYNPDIVDASLTFLQVSMISVARDFCDKSKELPQALRENEELFNELANYIHTMLVQRGIVYREDDVFIQQEGVYANVLNEAYLELSQIFYRVAGFEGIEYMNKKLEDISSKIIKANLNH